MRKINNYWYKEKPSSIHLLTSRLLVPLFALFAVVLFGFQPAFSESNNIVGQDTSAAESPSLVNLPNDQEKYLNNEGSSGSAEKNSASISNGEVVVQINDSTKADTSQSNSNISITVKNSSTPNPENPSEPSATPNIVINGEEIVIPDNGRVRQTLRDENSTTRLRTNIDSDGSSSISINSNTN